MCHEFFKDKTSYKKHKAEHQRELDVITLKDVCKECSICFGSREDYLEHLLQKHRPKKSAEVKSVSSNSQEPEECENLPWKTVQTRRQKQKSNQQKSPRKQQHSNQQQTSHLQKKQFQRKPACDNGPSCKFLKEDRCNFFHKEINHQGKQHGHETRSGAQQLGGWIRSLKQCKFGRSCDKGRDCGFLHLPKDFLPPQSGRRNKKIRKMVIRVVGELVSVL